MVSKKTLNELGAIASTPYLKMKFPTLTIEIVTIKANQKQTQQCYAESLKVAPFLPVRESSKPYPTSAGSNQVISVGEESPIRTLVAYKATRRDQDGIFDVDSHDNTIDKGPKPIGELVKLQLRPKLGQCMQLSRDLTSHEYRRITNVLQRNSNLLGIHPSVICHKLAICPQVKPVSQKKRKMGEERRKAVREEVDKLLKAQFIKEVRHSTYLANVIMVKKANGKWRMCIDYIDVNKACPKDAYPISRSTG